MCGSESPLLGVGSADGSVEVNGTVFLVSMMLWARALAVVINN